MRFIKWWLFLLTIVLIVQMFEQRHVMSELEDLKFDLQLKEKELRGILWKLAK